MSKKLKILTPEEKLKYPSSGGGYVGLSTTDVKSYAEDIAQTMTGDRKNIAEFYINPKAKILNIKDKHIDDFSSDEIEQFAKKYDIIKSSQENEYRILTENGVLTKKELESIWKNTKASQAGISNYTGTAQQNNILTKSLNGKKVVNNTPTFDELISFKTKDKDVLNLQNELLDLNLRIYDDSIDEIDVTDLVDSFEETKSQLTDIWNKANKK